MKNYLIIALFIIMNSVKAQQISSTFDTDVDNWLVSGDATNAIPNYIATGGNPSGYASADDSATGGVWVWSAPAKFLGNQSNSFGKLLTFDLKQNSLSSQFDDNDILITTPTFRIVLDLSQNPGLDWTSYSVKLDNTNPWKIDNITTGVLATNAQILEALSNILSLKIRGEYVSGSDTGGLDNVILGTIPLGVEKFSNSQLRCYPNPSNGIFTIQTVNAIENATIIVADLNARIVFETRSENLNNQKLDLSQLQNGIYILKISNVNTNYSQKLVKQ